MSLPDFIRLLKTYQIGMLVDVRTIPRSRHNPQFNKDTLPAKLTLSGIRYRHLSGLGGLRKAKVDSINMGWRNASFRGFADYMQTVEFRRALKRLLSLAKPRRVAIMCAEAVPWRCHRSMIADALTVQGLEVRHIMSSKSAHMHQLTPWLKVRGTKIWYPLGKTKKISGKLRIES